MESSIMDEGLIEVILEKLEKQRLPRLLVLKEKVDSGCSLEDFDLDFLEISIADAKKTIPLINRHPEYHALAAHVMCLFEDISAKALAIEKRS